MTSLSANAPNSRFDWFKRIFSSRVTPPTTKKPASIIYAVDDHPPAAVTVTSAIQQVGLIAVNLVYPVLVFRAANASLGLATDLLGGAMLVLAFGTLLQVMRLGPVGSGYMCPSTFTATYLAPSLLAARTGALPLVFGMTAAAGLLQVAIAPVLNRLRGIFPPEISGLVIFMIGWSAGISGLRILLAPDTPTPSWDEMTVFALTLGTMTALNIWGNGIARMLCALIGLLVGYLAAGFFGFLSDGYYSLVQNVPWLGLPRFHFGWSFDVAMIAPFVIAAIAASMKAAGTITICQRINDANWVRPDMRSVTRGVLADGITTATAGLVGAVGTNTSTPGVGVAAAAGVTSRVVALVVGLVFLALGFCPKLTAVLAIMPRSVIVAALLFTVTFIIINGVQVMTSRLLDTRRTLVLGFAIVAGGAVEIFPLAVAAAPRQLAPVLGSSLVSATLIGLVLNLLFRIGVKQKAILQIERDAVDPAAIETFFMRQGSAWGARPEVVSRAIFGTTQLIDAVADHCWREGSLVVTATFDEFNLDVAVAYKGEQIEFPVRRPSIEDIRKTDEGVRLLAGYLLRENADRIYSERKGDQAMVRFHFDH